MLALPRSARVSGHRSSYGESFLPGCCAFENFPNTRITWSRPRTTKSCCWSCCTVMLNVSSSVVKITPFFTDSFVVDEKIDTVENPPDQV